MNSPVRSQGTIDNIANLDPVDAEHNAHEASDDTEPLHRCLPPCHSKGQSIDEPSQYRFLGSCGVKQTYHLGQNDDRYGPFFTSYLIAVTVFIYLDEILSVDYSVPQLQLFTPWTNF